MGKSPKISIIIPVYNVEKYLRECIDSVISQTFAEWECILVDDGSKDNSGAICDEYALKDSRFKVIHQQNAGVSTARNTGLDEAKCDWIAFIDSDDWIDNNYLEVLFDAAIKTDSDMVICGFVWQKEKNSWDSNSVVTEETVSYDTGGLDILTFSREEFLKEFPKMRIMSVTTFLHSPCMRIYRNNTNFYVRFDSNIKFGEDYLFNIEYYRRLQKISFVSNCAYHYRWIPDSVTKQVDKKIIDDHIVFDDATEKFFNAFLPKSVISSYYRFKRVQFKNLLNKVLRDMVYYKKNNSVLDYLINIINEKVSMKEIFVKPLKIKEFVPLLLNKLHLVKILYMPFVKFWISIKKGK